jgi:hypothetical protein
MDRMGGCVFHAMEKFSDDFPRYGKLFSTPWKIRIDQNRRNGLGTGHTHYILSATGNGKGFSSFPDL